MDFATVALIGAVVCAGFCAFIAGEKHRPRGAWFVAGLFFGMFALIAIACVPALPYDPTRRTYWQRPNG